MAGLFGKQADIYVDIRPTYLSYYLFSMLASLTPHHSSAWDAGTGNGQAAIGVSPLFSSLSLSLSLSLSHTLFVVWSILASLNWAKIKKKKKKF